MKAGSMGSAIIIASISVVLIGGLMIYAGLFANASLIQTFDSTLNPTAATGAITFTGNVSNGEIVNITNGAIAYLFEFNTSTASPSVCKTIGCTIVNVYNTNTSLVSSGNLTAAINANAAVVAFVTAANTTNKTTLTYTATGITGNWIGTTDNVTTAAWSSSTLTGGVDGMSAYGNTKTNVNSAFVILGVVLIFAGIGGLIATVFGLVGTTGRRQ